MVTWTVAASLSPVLCVPYGTSDCSDIELFYMYIHAGDITITGDMTFTVVSDLNGASPRFILTCISTGGPATTVTWTRDSDTVMGDEMSEFITSPAATTAQYTHTLIVTERLGGEYTCNVSNDKPSSRTASFTVQGEL